MRFPPLVKFPDQLSEYFSEDIFADDDEAGSSSNKRVKFNESVAKIEVMWYYRFAGVTHGPFSSSDMFKMQDERWDKFKVIINVST